MRCQKCSYENLPGTAYCQGCGAKLKVRQKFFQWGSMKYAAGMGQKGNSIAPLGGMAVENQAKELGGIIEHKKLVKVRPKADGTWYCPDCGELNPQHAKFCKGCGRDFV